MQRQLGQNGEDSNPEEDSDSEGSSVTYGIAKSGAEISGRFKVDPIDSETNDGRNKEGKFPPARDFQAIMRPVTEKATVDSNSSDEKLERGRRSNFISLYCVLLVSLKEEKKN